MEGGVVALEEEEGLINISHMGRVALQVGRVSLGFEIRGLEKVPRMDKVGLGVVEECLGSIDHLDEVLRIGGVSLEVVSRCLETVSLESRDVVVDGVQCIRITCVLRKPIGYGIST
jgi:hypothetical protein